MSCQLPEYKRCCCTCQFHLADFYHCTTMSKELKALHGPNCVCSIQKGWICGMPESDRMYSGWLEHGLCEMHTKPNEGEKS